MSIALAILILATLAFGYVCHERGKIVGIGLGRKAEREFMQGVRPHKSQRKRANWRCWGAGL